MTGISTIYTCHYTGPCGELLLASFNGQLCMCDWTSSKRHADNRIILEKYLQAEFSSTPDRITTNAATELDEYFSGHRTSFDIPLIIAGTEFQRRVRARLLEIPYGSTMSYSGLATLIGSPHGFRSVASAIASNPLSIFIPCHRIIGSDNTLKGYAGGLHNKQKLLELEQKFKPAH